MKNEKLGCDICIVLQFTYRCFIFVVWTHPTAFRFGENTRGGFAVLLLAVPYVLLLCIQKTSELLQTSQFHKKTFLDIPRLIQMLGITTILYGTCFKECYRKRLPLLLMASKKQVFMDFKEIIIFKRKNSDMIETLFHYLFIVLFSSLLFS